MPPSPYERLVIVASNQCDLHLPLALRRISLWCFHRHSLPQNRASPRFLSRPEPPLRNGVLQCSQVLKIVPVAAMRAAYNMSAFGRSSGFSASLNLPVLSRSKKIPTLPIRGGLLLGSTSAPIISASRYPNSS